MIKEKSQQRELTPPDGPVEVVGTRRNGEWKVILRSRVGGKIEESVLKATADKRIMADRLQAVVLEVFR